MAHIAASPSTAAALLRVEARRRSEEWLWGLAKVGPWFQAADWLEGQAVPEPLSQEADNLGAGADKPEPSNSGSNLSEISLETLARALRADNTEGRGHANQPSWEEVDQHIRDIWLKRAEQVAGYIVRESATKATKTRP